MARHKPDRSPERGVRRAETNAVAAYLTALRAAKVPKRDRAKIEARRVQVEQWIAEEQSPIRQVELIQRRPDIDAQLAQADQADRLGELEEAFVNVAALWAERSGITAAALRESASRPACSGGLASCEREGVMDHYRFPPPPPPPPRPVEKERMRQARRRTVLIAALVVGVPMAAVFLAAMATGLINTLGF